MNLTITTIDTKLARILEPRAPRPDLRLKAVRELRRAGLRAGVICAPVVPGITDSPKNPGSSRGATKKVDGKNIYANPLFLKPCSAEVFLPFLEQEFPAPGQGISQAYRGPRLPRYNAYARRISELMDRLRKKHGITREITRRGDIGPLPRPAEQQLTLFR